MEPQCGGRGYVFVEGKEDTTRPCPNRWAEQANTFLGPELVSVRHARWTPLFHHPRDRKGPPIDRTTQNLLIRCPWTGLLPHLKRAFALKYHRLGDGWFFRITDDLRLKNVGVGAESYKARSRQERDDITTYNSVADLVSEPDLVIIKLGCLGYKNVAAAGLLKEALLIRAGLNKPTWLVRDPDRPWNHSRDPDVMHYIEQNFEQLKVKPSDPGEGYKAVSNPFDDLDVDEDGDVSLEPPETPGALVPEDEEEEEAGEEVVFEEPGRSDVEEEEEEFDEVPGAWGLPGEDKKKGGQW